MFFQRERIGEIIKQLGQRCYKKGTEVKQWRGRIGQIAITDAFETDTSKWSETDPGILGKEKSAYFGIAAEVTIPEWMKGMPVELFISTGREGEWDATNPQIAAYVNGKLTQGMDVNHRNLLLSASADGGECISVVLSVYTGEEGSIYQWNSVLRAIEKKVYDLYYDLLIPWQCLELMEEDSKEYTRLIGILNRTINLLDFRTQANFEISVDEATAYLKKETERLPESDLVVSCIGHTHIDVAWLWTYAVTQEKAARSFSTVLKLMEKYPEYQFMSSQAQLYKYVKQNQPKLYERIRERVKEGRWETEGGMFVEADCNLASGESLIRQFLYGKKFFRDEFGQEHKILWLPDVFGYSAALPQIMDKCGIESFMTTKISWNEINKIPYDSFWWEGIDGTRILTHFITARDYNNHGKMIRTGNEHTTEHTTNYNGVTHPSQVKGAWQRYQQKAVNDHVLISYGYGDGGGGSTDWMVESALRLQKGTYGTPKVKLEKAGEFFERLHKTAEQQEFPVWSGELYLEYHRGTYTSMAEIKRANRKGEFALQNAETWAALAAHYTGAPYAADELYQGWELLMRNQFHDVLPGSAVEAVYQDAREQYQELFEITAKVQQEALQTLIANIAADTGAVIVFNPNGLMQDGMVELDGKEELDELLRNSKGIIQKSANDKYLLRVKDIPAKGWKKYSLKQMAESPQMDDQKQKLSGQNADCDLFYCTETETVTPFYHLKWNEKGQIISYYDKQANRELLKEGTCANVLMTYEDKPHIFDNWNIFDYYREKSWEIDQLISRRVIEQGSVRMALELKWKYLNSEIKEIFYFYPDSARIDIAAELEWNEEQLLLKALFPLELNSREACYEIQYGNVKRSITKNHSWEQARFEVCFQKWLDLAEYDYGVSFITDCKYGVSIYDSQVELTLLKCGNYPNPKADRGHHEFVYAVYPHEGDWQKAGTVKEAYEVNNPVTAVWKADCQEGMKADLTEKANQADGMLPGNYAPIQTDAGNLIFEVWKASEDGKAEIVRLYECWNRRTRATLKFAETYKKITVCDMLENEQLLVGELTDQVELTVKPYEILTLKLESC